jgi:hypothetical protein
VAAAVDLSAIAAGIGGFVINGQCAYDYSGVSVSAAGDVNGDGLADLIVGAFWSDPAGGQLRRAQLCRLRPDRRQLPSTSRRSPPGIGGFVINGQCAGDQWLERLGGRRRQWRRSRRPDRRGATAIRRRAAEPAAAT